MRWSFLLSAAGLLLIVSVVAVLIFFNPFTSTEAADYGGTYVEGVAGRPVAINPILGVGNDIDRDLVRLIFSGLTRANPDGTFAPDLAKDWTISPDGRVYTFHLRPNVTWHDGQPFSADDVVYTIGAVQDKDFQGIPGVAELWRGVRVEKIDSFTVRFTLNTPNAAFLEFTSMGVLPAHLLKDVPAKNLPQHAFNAAPVGTGPFRLRDITIEQADLEAYAGYYGNQPYIRNIVVRFYPTERASLNALRQEDVQGIRQIAADDIPGLLASTGNRITIYRTTDASKTALLVFNLRQPLFADKTVRQALALAIDRTAIVSDVLQNTAVAETGPVRPGSWATPKDNGSSYDPAKAKAMLDAAGWLPGPDGIRTRNGQKLAFVLMTNTAPERVKVAQNVVNFWNAIGAKVDLQTVGWDALNRDFLGRRNFQVVLTEYSLPQADPDPSAFWLSSYAQNGLNFSGWTNPEADSLLQRAVQSMNRDERTKLYGDFAALFAQEQPAIPLYHPVYFYAISRSVRGVDLPVLTDMPDRWANLADWYVRSRRVNRGMQPGSTPLRLPPPFPTPTPVAVR